MHHPGVTDDARGLVGLKLPDEMPSQFRGKVRAFGRLGRRFLVPVLPHIPHAKFAEQSHVRRGKRLSHRNQRDFSRIPPHRHTGIPDPPLQCGQPCFQFRPPLLHTRHTHIITPLSAPKPTRVGRGTRPRRMERARGWMKGKSSGWEEWKRARRAPAARTTPARNHLSLFSPHGPD